MPDALGLTHTATMTGDVLTGFAEIYALDDAEHLPELSALSASLSTALDAHTGELDSCALLELIGADRRLELIGAYSTSGSLHGVGMQLGDGIRQAVAAGLHSELPADIWPRLSAELVALASTEQQAFPPPVCGTVAVDPVPVVNAILVAPLQQNTTGYQVVLVAVAPQRDLLTLPMRAGEQAYSVRVLSLAFDVEGYVS
jgi:hypothetical protein